MRQIAGGSREQTEQAVVSVRVNRAHGDAFAAKARRGERDEQALEGRLAVGELGETSVDQVSSGES